jgi:hypothetical protein
MWNYLIRALFSDRPGLDPLTRVFLEEVIPMTDWSTKPCLPGGLYLFTRARDGSQQIPLCNFVDLLCEPLGPFDDRVLPEHQVTITMQDFEVDSLRLAALAIFAFLRIRFPS